LPTLRPDSCICVAFLAIFASVAGTTKVQAAETEVALEWHRIPATDVAGKGWADTEQPFDRLPARAKSIVRPAVWDLARHSAGLYVDFATNAAAISARWTVTSDRLAMPHMPATGVSGVDLYVHRNGRWHYLGNGRPKDSPTNTAQLAADLPSAETEYRLYFPLYNGVSSLEIGVDQGATFRIVTDNDVKTPAVVIHGTSITQGGCASRPGMSYASILGRRLDVPVINLGFSGNGKTEPEVAELLAEMNASAFVIDSLPNLEAHQVAERVPKFLEIIRSRHPRTPILLMECPLFPAMPFSAPRAERVNASNKHARNIYETRVASGDQHIWLVPACDFTTNGGEATVDGIHPTDVGFLQLANAVESPLRAVLDRKTK
jgi:hypothetical protein